MNRKYNFLLLVFFILCLINLWGVYQMDKIIIYLTKPLLITTLALWFWYKTKLKTLFARQVYYALIFSIIGDSFLMMVENDGSNGHYFLFGLGSFLVAHIFYFFAFKNHQKDKMGLLRKNVWAALPLIIYFAVFNSFLLPAVPGAMLIPVIFYSIAITGMSLACLHLYGKMNPVAFRFLFIGVLLFILSDSIIAINKFQSDQLIIPYARLWIMATYLAAQFLIVKGAVNASLQLQSKS